jgi:hypothetical protein
MVSASTWCIDPGNCSKLLSPSVEKTLEKPVRGAPVGSCADKVPVSALYLL